MNQVLDQKEFIDFVFPYTTVDNINFDIQARVYLDCTYYNDVITINFDYKTLTEKDISDKEDELIQEYLKVQIENKILDILSQHIEQEKKEMGEKENG